jgi:CRISPR-associated protein Csb2
VRFRNPVMGPVLAGIGRHYGIGLFAAVGGG